jgi:uncharacterized protein YkwD
MGICDNQNLLSTPTAKMPNPAALKHNGRRRPAMTTVEIQLPDQLAQDAERAGLLSPTALEELLRKQLRSQSAAALSEAMTRISAVNDLPYMSPEDVAEEIAAMRAERRAANGR